ncbi:MAG TPA: MMPL family transporter [Actinocrinis sp.]|nr:MMPL family transporter [Actinocrinis sp.]
MSTALRAAVIKHPALTSLVWLVLIFLGFTIGGQVTGRFTGGVGVPASSESAQAGNVLDDADKAGDSITAVVGNAGGTDGSVTSPAFRQQIEHILTTVRAIPGVESVPDPYPHSGVSADQQALGISVQFRFTLTDDARDTAEDNAYTALHTITGADVDVTGGHLLNQQMNHSIKKSAQLAEELSLPIVLIGLFFVFGGFVAAALPLAVAVCAISCTLLILFGFSEVTSISTYALQITTMIGLGLAVDYSLLIITRFREERVHTWDKQKAVERTLRTAGRTVLFSGLTVTMCALGLTVFDSSFLRSMGLAVAAVVAVDMVAALTLLPALLVLCGGRIKPRATFSDDGMFARIGRFAVRFRLPVLLGLVAVLAAGAAPLLSLSLSNGDARSLPPGSEPRAAYEVQEAHWGNASTSPIEVLFEGRGTAYDAFARTLPTLPGVLSATNSTLSTGDLLVDLVPSGSDDGDVAQGVVRQIRADRGTLNVQVTGRAAQVVDFDDMLGQGLPWALLLVGAAILVLLFAFTGSVLIPVKTILTTLLSLGAALGVVTWVFQDGHFAGLFGAQGVGSLNITTVPLVGAIAFGLAMDYEVFILARVRELYLRRRSAAGPAESVTAAVEAVPVGLQRSGRIVTSAALLISVVFACFMVGGSAIIGQIGLGLTVAVLVDATLVRVLLVPATMGLLGRAAWWAPAPLRRLHDRFGLAEADSDAEAADGATSAGGRSTDDRGEDADGGPAAATDTAADAAAGLTP